MLFIRLNNEVFTERFPVKMAVNGQILRICLSLTLFTILHVWF